MVNYAYDTIYHKTLLDHSATDACRSAGKISVKEYSLLLNDCM